MNRASITRQSPRMGKRRRKRPAACGEKHEDAAPPIEKPPIARGCRAMLLTAGPAGSRMRDILGRLIHCARLRRYFGYFVEGTQTFNSSGIVPEY